MTFTLPNVDDGRPFQIDAADWTDLHRAIIGDFLGYLSAESYSHAGIFISSIVVTKDDGTPGYGFTEFMREIGVLTSSEPTAAVTCWVEQVRKVFDWYSRRRA